MHKKLTLRYRIKRHKQVQRQLILRKENYAQYKLHCKKRLAIFLYPARDAPARESLVSDIPAGDGKIANLFYSVHPIPLIINTN